MIKQHEREKKLPFTAQQTIPYRQMFKDGTCQVEDNYFTRIIEFEDISYQLADDEEQLVMFDNYCDFLNYFSEEIHVEFTFLNQHINFEELKKLIEIPLSADRYNHLRDEYQGYLQSQLAQGNNGLMRTKLCIFGIRADGIKQARQRLNRIEIEIMNNFKSMGCAATRLRGKEYLEILYRCMNRNRRFMFDWNQASQKGRSTKDFIAPDGFDFSKSGMFKMGRQVGVVSYVDILAEKISDRFLSDILDQESSMILSMHIEAYNQVAAIKLVNRTLSDLQRMSIEEQKRALRGGYDYDNIPSELVDRIQDLRTLKTKLGDQNQRLFKVSLILANIADHPKYLRLENKNTSDTVQKYNCQLRPLNHQQEKGFVASLPLGINKVKVEQPLTTRETAIFMPFTTQSLFQIGRSSLYYGLNPLNNNMILADRKQLRSPCGLFLGTPGGGKSFAIKRETIGAFLQTNDDFINIDPEGEMIEITKQLGGTLVNLCLGSNDHVNPLDIDLDEEGAMASKVDFLLSFFELVMRKPAGLEAGEMTIIDRCTPLVYREYLQNPIPENMPILSDFYNALLEQPEPEAKKLAQGLEMHVLGQMNMFNHQTNVDMSNRMVTFNIRDLGTHLKPLGMLTIEEFSWQRVKQNQAQGKYTRVNIDEFHLLLRDPQTADYSVTCWKRYRKYGGIATGLTQNVKDLLASRKIENILETSDFLLLLNQAHGDKYELMERLQISPQLANYITDAAPGCGLVIYGGIKLPMVDHFPKDTQIYRAITTKLEEVVAQRA